MNIGKICRFVALPDGFTFPLSQILNMWTLFAKYEGLDESGMFNAFAFPNAIEKKYQATLYFGKGDNRLRKVLYAGMFFAVDAFEPSIFPRDSFALRSF